VLAHKKHFKKFSVLTYSVNKLYLKRTQVGYIITMYICRIMFVHKSFTCFCLVDAEQNTIWTLLFACYIHSINTLSCYIREDGHS